MAIIDEQRDELAKLTRQANQLASELSDTRNRIRTIIGEMGLPPIRLLKSRPGSLIGYPLKFGPKTSVREGLPQPWKTVRIHRDDGTTSLAVWTGVVWWAQGRQQQPTHWQTMVPERGVKKRERAASA